MTERNKISDLDNANVDCSICGGDGWVCEEHIDKPWDGVSNAENACNCGGAGSPCSCNPLSGYNA